MEFKTPKGTVLPILDMRGKPYLQVAQRLVWFREERPNWTIETKPVSITANESVFSAAIRDESGRLIATSHKSENKQGFQDHIEKAETGSIGRALALCGYGTQFCGDELDEGERLADSPVQQRPKPNFAPKPQGAAPSGVGEALCELCGTGLVISKSGLGFYCPQFKSGGEHTRIKKDDLAAFIEASKSKPRDFDGSNFDDKVL